MKPVMMESRTSEVESYRAAVASILGLELDVLPAFDGPTGPMEWDAWFARELNMVVVRFEEGFSPPRCYWVAAVASPYHGTDVHFVVMQREQLVHDPHPEAEWFDVRPVLVMMDVFVPLDPSLPAGGAALSS
jgi:hypothetical protein